MNEDIWCVNCGIPIKDNGHILCNDCTGDTRECEDPDIVYPEFDEWHDVED